MKRKTKQIVIVGIMFSVYSIYSNFFAVIYPMTDEQYAREAQKIVNDNLAPCQSPIDTARDYQSKLTCNE